MFMDNGSHKVYLRKVCEDIDWKEQIGQTFGKSERIERGKTVRDMVLFPKEIQVMVNFCFLQS